MSGRAIGIDMGTKRLKLYRKGQGVVFDQQNVVAIQKKKKVLAIGNEAAEMLDKAPEDIEVIYAGKTYKAITNKNGVATVTLKATSIGTKTATVKVNTYFYGRKHNSSGLYIITKQQDSISSAGSRTTLSLTRIGGDRDYV